MPCFTGIDNKNHNNDKNTAMNDVNKIIGVNDDMRT